jgi:hypothetical protein
LLSSTVPLVVLLRLDSVLLKKLSLAEIEKESDDISSSSGTEVTVNEKKRMIIPIVDPIHILRVMLRFNQNLLICDLL